MQLYNGATDEVWSLTNTIDFQNGSTSYNDIGNPIVAVSTPPISAQAISFTSLSDVAYSNGTTINLAATASSGLGVSYTTPSTNLVSISSNVVTLLGVGTATIVASQNGNSNYLAATPVTNMLVIRKGNAAVNLSQTNATYDGTIKRVVASTVPTDLSVGLTYNGSSNAPSNAGSYIVVGTVNDPYYAGSATATLAIVQALPGFGFSSGSQSATYIGSNVAVTLTNATGVPVIVTYSNSIYGLSTNPPTNSGTYTVVASLNDTSNYLPYSVTQSLTIALPTPGGGTNIPVLSLANDSSFAGAITISNSVVILGNGGSSGSISNVSSVNLQGGVIMVNRSDTVTQGGAFKGVISGDGGFVQAGTGTTILTEANTYSGTTEVRSGTLALVGTSSLSNSVTFKINGNLDLTRLTNEFVLASGRTLGGSGTVTTAPGQSVTAVSGAILSPGNSPGNLSISSLVINGGANYNWQITDANGVAGVGYDTITAGTLDLSSLKSPVSINLGTLSSVNPDISGPANNFDPSLKYSWAIFSYTNQSGTFDSSLFAVNTSSNNGVGGFANAFGGSFTVTDSNNAIWLNYSRLSNLITFPSLSGVTYSNGVTIGLAATASSGLAVSYSSANTNLVSISGTNATFLGAGTTTIVASQAGNSNYLAATPVTNTLVIGKGSVTVSFSGTNGTYDGTVKSVLASTVPTNLSVGITYNGSSNAPINAGSYSVLGVVNIPNYQGSSSTTLTIAQASNVITFPALSGVTYSNGLTIGLGAIASSGLDVSYSSSSTNVSIVGTNVTVLGAGTASIVASQSGNSNYLAATPVTNSFEISSSQATSGVCIYIAGSTSFRSVVNRLMIGTYGQKLAATSGTNATDANASYMLFTNCLVNGSTVDISLSWSGSLVGLRSVASPSSNPVTASFLTSDLVNSNAAVKPILNASSALLATNRADIAFSDTWQAVSGFQGASKDKRTYAVLNDTKVAVVPFNYVANKGTGIDNIGITTVYQLATRGRVPASLVTGNPADVTGGAYFTGRDPFSGARSTVLNVSKVGNNSAVQNYKPVVSGGKITSLVNYSATNIMGFDVTSAGNGECSGGAVVAYMTNTMSATVGGVPILVNGRGNTNILVSYCSAADMTGVLGAGIVPLKFEGINGRFGLTNEWTNRGSTNTARDSGYTNIISGKYPLWSYEHILWDGRRVTTEASNTVSWLTNQIVAMTSTNPTLAPNIPLGEMRVYREKDGGDIKYSTNSALYR